MTELKKEHLPNYTYEDYKHWEGKWELIHGVPYAMIPSPKIEHQEVSLNIGFQLKNLLRIVKNAKPFCQLTGKLNSKKIILFYNPIIW